MGLNFILSLIAWSALVGGLGIGAARTTDRRPRLAFGMLVGAMLVMVWGLVAMVSS